MNSNSKETGVNYERYFVYGKYFARITKYIRRSINVMNNFHDSFHKYSNKFERPLFYLGLGCIAMTTSLEYSKLKNENNKSKCLFLVDTFQWHLFASFYFSKYNNK